MYMSYCRFEGTRAELRACLNDAQDHINGEAEYEISASEIKCFKDILNDMVDFLNDNCLIDEDGMLDREALDDVCRAMAKAGTDDEDEEEDE
jgi:hypothetical protein